MLTLIRLAKVSCESSNISRIYLAGEGSLSFFGSVVTLFLETDVGTEHKVQLRERELATLYDTSGGTFFELAGYQCACAAGELIHR